MLRELICPACGFAIPYSDDSASRVLKCENSNCCAVVSRRYERLHAGGEDDPDARDMRLSSSDRIRRLTLVVNPADHFVFADGTMVKNVAEMAAVLDRVDDEVFAAHVNESQNDIARWIENIFHEGALGKQIIGVDDRRQVQLLIYRYMAGR